MRKLHDPRIGIQNFEVSEISLGEPEEKLFKIGRDMKVIDLRKPAKAPPPVVSRISSAVLPTTPFRVNDCYCLDFNSYPFCGSVPT
jgi:hypothetical protein